MNFPEAVRIVCGRCGRHMVGCKTCPVLRTVEEYDSEQYTERQLNLIRSMTIKPVDNWFVGTIGGYPFQAKVTEEDSSFGIQDGRIIKLFVTDIPTDKNPGKTEIIAYERGWSKYPEKPEHEEILDALYEYFENHCEEGRIYDRYQYPD